MQVTLFIEGTPDDKNGNLRQGFGKLVEQKLRGQMPRIIMSDDKVSAIRKFKSDKLSTQKFLLVDLDGKEDTKAPQLKKFDLDGATAFFMIQELEAWFISQADILNLYYGIDIKSKVSPRDPKSIDNPSDLLAQLTKKTKKGEYHKVKHATDLLKMLKLTDVEDKFDDAKNLISAMKR